jgi:hypothetical protein
MQKRGFAAASVLLGSVLWAAGSAFAAPASSSFTGDTNLNLGSLFTSGFAQDHGAGLHVELGQVRNWDATHDLFPAASSLNSMFLSGSEMRTSAGVALAPGLNLNVSHVSLGLGSLGNIQAPSFPQDLATRLDPSLRSTGTTVANLNLNLTSWSDLAITASHSSGNAGLLGTAPDTLRLASATDSSALGISARVGFAEGWVTTLAYAEGVAQLDLSQIGSANAVRSDSYGIGFAKTGLFGNDAFGIALSRPLQPLYPTSAGANSSSNFGLNSSQARESDVELGYVTSFLDGTLALQANAAYQVNAAGNRGQNALTGVARAKLNF